jgi:hypothetical protein
MKVLFFPFLLWFLVGAVNAAQVNFQQMLAELPACSVSLCS